MVYKIGFFLGAALIAILAVENLVVGSPWYLFLDRNASVGMIVIVAAAIWVIMWYCAPYAFSKKWTSDDESFDF